MKSIKNQLNATRCQVWLITITDLFHLCFRINDLGLEQTDHINQMLSSNVITRSGEYNTFKTIAETAKQLY